MMFEVIRDRIIPATWKKVTDEDAQPRGWTPLNDAIGRIVSLAKSGFNGVPYDKLALIIVTDGQENSSKELNHASARKLLDECRAKGWQVIFLGADFDNFTQASSYGTMAAQTISASVENFAGTMRMSAMKRGLYGSGAASNMAFSDDEKRQAASGSDNTTKQTP